MMCDLRRCSTVREFYAGVALVATFCLALAGCGASAAATPTATTLPSPTTPATITTIPTQQPPSRPPTPIPAGTFTTYTNTLYHYSISYPSNWVVVNGTATSQAFNLLNYDPQSYQQPSTTPPLLKVEIDAVANPSHLAPLDFFTQSISGPGEAPATITSSQATALAGRAAEKVIVTVAPSQYPDITYLIPMGDTMLIITQNDAQGGQPSPAFTQMLNSLSITG